jgi:hypothetical protein
MARKMHELLWNLREDTANEISEPQEREEISAWLDEQSELTAVFLRQGCGHTGPFPRAGTV